MAARAGLSDQSRPVWGHSEGGEEGVGCVSERHAEWAPGLGSLKRHGMSGGQVSGAGRDRVTEMVFEWARGQTWPGR